MELTDADTGEVYQRFFDAKRTGKKRFNYAVSPKSKFAQLYKKSTGKQPKRWNQSEQLAGHLIGLEFYCTTKKQRSQSGIEYLKVDKIRPKEAFKLSVLENDTLKSKRRQIEDKLKTQEISEAQVNSMPEGSFRTPISYTEETISVGGKEHHIKKQTEYKVLNETGGFTFLNMPGETEDQIQDRMIEETWL